MACYRVSCWIAGSADADLDEGSRQAIRREVGYSLHSMFPALFGYVVGNRSIPLFLRDWRVTLNDLLVENFFGEMKLGR